jgi:hypothetical protein
VTALYEAIVRNDDIGAAEAAIDEARRAGWFEVHAQQHEPGRAYWQQIVPRSLSAAWPAGRGGHQLVVDAHARHIWLFG